MVGLQLETNRLLLRNFEETDIDSLHLLLKDEEVNTFLPWFSIKNIEEVRDFYKKQFKGKEYRRLPGITPMPPF